MKYILSIDCDSDAFTDPGTVAAVSLTDPRHAHRRRSEVARILQAAAVQIGVYGKDEGVVSDLNGKIVGAFVFDA